MDNPQSLAAHFRNLARDIRHEVNEQDIRVFARQIDLVRPVQAGRLLCAALDIGCLDDGSWDLRRYAMGANEDSYMWLMRLRAGGEDAESFWPAGAAKADGELSPEEEHLDAILKASRFFQPTETNEQENLLSDLGYLFSWWKFIFELWNSDSLRFPPDTERHFLLLRWFLTIVNHPNVAVPDADHRYPPLDEKSARSRQRLRGAAELQATACEIAADMMEQGKKSRGSVPVLSNNVADATAPLDEAGSGEAGKESRKNGVSFDRSKLELVKAVLRKHHIDSNSDGTTNSDPLTLRKIEELTGRDVSDTTARRILQQWFGSVSGYKAACREGMVAVRLDALEDGLKFLQTVAPGSLDAQFDSEGTRLRSNRKSKPVVEDHE